jgi:uncharacterized protein (DUF302 family)
MADLPSIPYGFQQRLPGTTLDAAVEQVGSALAKEGFGVLTKIDVKDTLKQKLGVDVLAYVILGACNPTLAHQAIAVEPQIGLLLPCNIVIREVSEGDVVVSITDPRALFATVNNPRLAPVVDDVERRLRRVMRTLVTTEDARSRS